MPSKPNRLLCGDTLYDLTPAYIAGARALRKEVPHWANPYDDDTEEQDYADWDDGHTNEAAHEHHRFGEDVIALPPEGREIEEDPSIPRDEHGNIDPDSVT
jgi:hypothetical protein